MLLGAYQILHTNNAIHASVFETVDVANILKKPWAKALVNAILRQIERDRDKLKTQTHYSHPSWLLKKIKQYYPKHFEQIFRANNTQAPMTLRLHPKYNLNPDIGSKALSVAPQARILDKPSNVNELPDFDQGCCFIQDGSAQLAGHLLNPQNTDSILDACCAPGGKTTHLSELAPTSSIFALDNNAQRLEKVKQNINRFSIKNIHLLRGNAQTQDWWNEQLFDKILLDAPCSATGVIRRHPDIKLLRKPKDISTLVALQQQILSNLWTMLKPGGILLYATCSVLKSENEMQMAEFLATHPNASEIEIDSDWGMNVSIGKQQLPCYEFDGFYYAKLIKC